MVWRYLLAVLGSGFAMVATEEELPVEELDPHHGEDEEKQHVHDQDIEHISKQIISKQNSIREKVRMWNSFTNK